MTVHSDPKVSGDFDDPDDSPRAGLIRAVKLAGAGTLTLFMAGGTAGAFAAMAEDQQMSAKGLAVVAAFAIGAIAAAIWFVRLLRIRASDPLRPARVARANQMLVASGAIGGVLALMFAMGGISDPTFMFSDAPVSPAIALIALALVGIAAPVVTLIWHRNVDEHEERIYRFASLIAIYTYFWVSVVWWIAARGGFLPPGRREGHLHHRLGGVGLVMALGQVPMTSATSRDHGNARQTHHRNHAGPDARHGRRRPAGAGRNPRGARNGQDGIECIDNRTFRAGRERRRS